ARPGQADAPGGRPKKVLTARQRRQAVCSLQERFGVSERRACRVLGQQRSTQRQPRKKAPAEEGRLVARMLELVRKHPRFGYRRVWALLRRAGWWRKPKRGLRLGRREGAGAPPQPGKNWAPGTRRQPLGRQAARP